MCGLAGFFNVKTDNPEAMIQEMTGEIFHRGPDALGKCHFAVNDRFTALGHARLSIIDLSSSANQPFYSSCGRYVIVYNGEVYNFRELRDKLRVNCRTSCDTEVILELFVQEGPRFVSALNGMFSFVIYDIQEGLLYLYRDRLGVKPLFYCHIDDELYFASEIKSILSVGKIKNRLSFNTEALNLYFHLGYIPQPHSIYSEIKKFPSGSYAIFDRDGMDFCSYWKAESKIDSTVLADLSTAKTQLKNLLESSVAYRMVSDVPVGTFLSGGVDSSLVTAIAQQQHSSAVKTFSIGFKESKFNEAKYAADIAKHLGTEHSEYILSEQDALEHLLPVMDQYDEPFADSSALPVYLISRMAREKVSVVLTGDGGDENFMGYGSYTWAERMNNPMLYALRQPLSFLLRSSGKSRFKRIGDMLDVKNKEGIESHIFSQEQYFFASQELSFLLNSSFCEKISMPFSYEMDRTLNPSEKQAFFDLNFYLRDDLLVKVDRASMKCSLEAREPLLDYRLIEFALNLSYDLKVKNDEKKYLLQQVLYDYIPQKYFQRPKWGFSIPLAKWLKNDLYYLIDKHLSRKAVEYVGVLNFSYIDQLRKRFIAGEDYLFHRIWLAIVFQRWAENSAFNILLKK